MIVQLERVMPPVKTEVIPGSGEDEGFGEPREVVETAPTEPVYIDVNPRYISFVFESREPGVTIVKGPDGRGFKVKGTYAEVHAKLTAGGYEDPEVRH